MTYNRFVFYFGLVMSLVYVAAGVFIFLKGENTFSLSGTQKILLSILLAGYGCYRFSRYAKSKREQDNEPENEN